MLVSSIFYKSRLSQSFVFLMTDLLSLLHWKCTSDNVTKTPVQLGLEKLIFHKTPVKSEWITHTSAVKLLLPCQVKLWGQLIIMIIRQIKKQWCNSSSAVAASPVPSPPSIWGFSSSSLGLLLCPAFWLKGVFFSLLWWCDWVTAVWYFILVSLHY